MHVSLLFVGKKSVGGLAFAEHSAGRPEASVVSWVKGETWVRSIEHDVIGFWIAAREKATPSSAKTFAGAVAAYALWQVFLIADSIPVPACLDDPVIMPFGIILAGRLIPGFLMAFRPRLVNE